MNTNKWIAVAVGIALVAFFMYGNTLISFFRGGTNQMTNTSGVQIEELQAGSGDMARSGDTVTLHYVGSLTNGQVFDSSRDRNLPFTFVLGNGQVIRGFDEGVTGMKVGEKRRIVISPDFGYGPNQVGAIPPNSTLIFDVELLGIQKGTSTQATSTTP